MMAWNPYKPVASHQALDIHHCGRDRDGVGIPVRFSSYHPPTQIIQFSFAHNVFSVTGGGTMQLTTPTGQRLTGRIPFQLRAGKVVELAHAPTPHIAGGF